ncbi:MAG: hypothetical protein IPK94_05760 [Saprospiraceae bacterium]|nr:hypothetical protein [Saprospiraceae bacterium]
MIESKEVAIKYHTHGLGMMMWCMMLISQALLIRINKNSIHRLIGKFSYLLVPYIFFSTLDLVHSLMAEVTTWRAIDLLTWPSWSMQLFFCPFICPGDLSSKTSRFACQVYGINYFSFVYAGHR